MMVSSSDKASPASLRSASRPFLPCAAHAATQMTQSGRLKGWGVWEDHQARDRRDASTLDILATPQFRKRTQKSDRDDGQNELRNDSR
jgi:hypothetical protein